MVCDRDHQCMQCNIWPRQSGSLSASVPETAMFDPRIHMRICLQEKIGPTTTHNFVNRSEDAHRYSSPQLLRSSSSGYTTATPQVGNWNSNTYHAYAWSYIKVIHRNRLTSLQVHIVKWTKGFHFLPLGGSFKPCKRALHITELLVYYFCFYS